MTALLLAVGVTAHVWVVIWAHGVVVNILRDEREAATIGVMFAFPGLYVCVYFWARVGGLA